MTGSASIIKRMESAIVCASIVMCALIYTVESAQLSSQPIETKSKYVGDDANDNIIELPARKPIQPYTRLPANCVWSEWSPWSECTESCGGGMQQRNRDHLIEAEVGGKRCVGPHMEFRQCNEMRCVEPVHCVWAPWSEFNECTVSCGGGTKDRRRFIRTKEANGGMSCLGASYQQTWCGIQRCPFDCEWDKWGEWTECSRTCGGGVQYRYREKAQEATPMGRPCSGSGREMNRCKLEPCPVDCQWGTWSSWSACSVTCGGGSKYRTRSVSQPELYGGVKCSGASKETKLCGDNKCPVDCSWDAWSGWSECPVSCGGGTQTRVRRTKQLSTFGGAPCIGDSAEVKQCSANACPLDCMWGPWSSWTGCTTTCGKAGRQRRSRPSSIVMYGGKQCEGSAFEERVCNDRGCPIDCVWDPWMPWTQCSKECGIGKRTRVRRVKSPATNNGLDCEGEDSQEETCNTHGCTCQYTEWGQCSATCGDGVQSRDLLNPLICKQPGNTKQSCSNGACVCQYGPWSACSATCGVGQQTRVSLNPTCGLNIMPTVQTCNLGGCQCQYSEWTKCSVTCGEGQQLRNLLNPDCGGTAAVQSRKCSLTACACQFSAWGDCSLPCGGGTRTRVAVNLPCEMKQAPTSQACNTDLCPCEYGKFAECSVSCGSGTRTRTAINMPCRPTAERTSEVCNPQLCPTSAS